MRKLIPLMLGLALLTGCQSSPQPARTRLEGGESRLISERLERRPVESRMLITAETALPPPPPPAPPTYIIRVITPAPEKKPE